MQKPTIFISHIHDEETCANALEKVLRKALLGALDIFNSSNRQSIAAGDPWRDKIVATLKNTASVLVLASPNSVSSPWVNFETGGAWISGTRVVPCCIKGMTPSSLPAPLSHLQALNLELPEDLRLLVKHLADVAGLDVPDGFDFTAAAAEIIKSWDSGVSGSKNEDFVSWFKKVDRRPEKYRGEIATGYFRVTNLKASSPQETKQFKGEKLTPGDTLSCWIFLEGSSDAMSHHCFATGNVADLLETLQGQSMLHGKVKCLGQLKVFDIDLPDFDESERGISYPAAWLIVDAGKAPPQSSQVIT